jgi:phosphoribosyl 1,2-cyclic phosphodiesterase
MTQGEAKVVLLGTRGTISAEGDKFALYGGATSCVLARVGGELIFLDAGSGIIHAEDFLEAEDRRLSILLSHPHSDHIMGLLVFPPLFNPAFNIAIYAAERGGLSARGQLERLMSAPLWPVTPAVFAPGVEFNTPEQSFKIGQVNIDTMEAKHPGGSTIYRLSCGGKSIVYAVDFEHEEGVSARLADFAAGCDLLIYDAQYSDEEYESKRGWGHSTWNEGAKAAERCGAKKLVLIHHDPWRTDEELGDIERSMREKHKNLSFGKHGEEIIL